MQPTYSHRYLLHLLRRHSKAPTAAVLPQILALLTTSGLAPTFLHNSLIGAHHGPSILHHFKRMLRLRVPPNSHTFPPLIHAAAAADSCDSSTIVASLHAQVVARGLSSDPVIGTCLIVFYGEIVGGMACVRRMFEEMRERDLVSYNSYLDAFCKNGELECAVGVFERMTVRDVVTWTSMINGFKRSNRILDAICLFKTMVETTHIVPNEATLVSVLSCIAIVADETEVLIASHLERQIHGFITRNGIEFTDFIGTALIDCYGKDSNVDYARRVFKQSRGREVCIWNAMISSLASNGLESDALILFRQMRGRGLKPNNITYVGVLTACSRAGLVNVGVKWFKAMEEDGIKPTNEHYGCMVDLLGKSGHLKEAAKLVNKMPEDADPSVLGALLGACRLHGEVELGAEIAKRLMELQSSQSGSYVVLSNLYARVGRWVEAAQTREDMGNAGVKKIVGVSKAFTGC